MSRFLVKGAGVAGLTAAFELVRRGHDVDLVEKGGAVGHGASHFAGGMLAPYCETEVAEEIVFTLGRQAADWWQQALPGCVTRNGTLVVAQARDYADLVRFSVQTSGHVWLGRGEIGELEPSLAGRFEKALFFEDEAHLDPRQALAALAEAFCRLGGQLHLGTDQHPARDYSAVLDCTGSAAITHMTGLRAIRGEMLYLETSDVALSRPVRMLHPRHPIYVVPRADQRFMVGATMIETADAGPISVRSLMELLNAAYALHPAFGEARVVETGVGLRPAFDENVPRIVPTDTGLAIAGMHRHGFLLSPAMAIAAAERLAGAFNSFARNVA